MTSNAVHSFLDNAVFTASNNQLNTLAPSIKQQKKPKPPPLKLDPEAHCWPLLNPLAEFAAIATSPQSPLVKQIMYEGGLYDFISRGHQEMESAQTAQKSRMNDSSGSTSYSPPIVDKASPSSGDESDLSLCGNSSYSWSTASIWQCLKPRTPLQYDDITYRGTAFSYSGPMVNSTAYQSGGLERDERTLSNEKDVSAIFQPHDRKESESEIAVESFTPQSKTLVKDTTWPPFYTNRALSSCGIPCRELLLRDICIPVSGPDEATTPSRESGVSPTSETSVLFDLDSAAHALSSMAKRKEEHDRYHRKVKATLQIVKRKGGTRIRKKRNENSQAKRPMNAFMLFAKRYRLEITQKHPGKDNRAISVVLGDQWKSLSYEDRKAYIVEAKLLADEHKRIYPDCWKRKRTSKVPSTTARKSGSHK